MSRRAAAASVRDPLRYRDRGHARQAWPRSQLALTGWELQLHDRIALCMTVRHL